MYNHHCGPRDEKLVLVGREGSSRRLAYAHREATCPCWGLELDKISTMILALKPDGVTYRFQEPMQDREFTLCAGLRVWAQSVEVDPT